MDQYLKTAGSALFWGNRTKPPYLQDGNNSYTPRAQTPPEVITYAFRYKKTDITVQPNSTLKTDGGFFIASGVPIAYESIEIGTGPDGSGFHGFARINVASGLFQNQDKITIGSKSVTLVTDGSGNGQDKLNIVTSPLSTQTSQITSYFNSPYSGGTAIPDSSRLTFADGGTFIYAQGRFLSNTADNLAIGVVSSNPDITVSQGIASPQKARVDIQNIRFRAFVAGSAGNNINVTYTTGAASSTPEISINGGNAVDIKIQSGVTTAQQIVNAVTASSLVNSVISAELIGATGSVVQTAPVSVKFLDGGTSHITNPWTRGDKLKNCFIVSPKFMCAHNGVTGDSSSLSEVSIPVNTIMHQTYHALQIINHPSFNQAAWYRKNVARNATVRIQGESSYNYVELELKVPGVVGNTYSFEVRNSPLLGLFNQPATPARFSLENSGKRIVLTLGVNGSTIAAHSSFSNFDAFNAAAINGDVSVLNLVKLNVLTNSWNITGAISERFFSGATASAGSDFVKDGAADVIWGSCRGTNYPGYYYQGEVGIDGKSKIADDIGGALKSSGKLGGVFARVVPAGTAFKASGFIGDLQLNTVVGGVVGNGYSIRYITGGTAGSEVVTVASGAITVQIEDAVSTAEQVRAAIAASSAANAIVTVKVIGNNSNPQSASMSPSPISFTGGAAALTKDAGYFITHRRNSNQADTNMTFAGSMTWEVMFSKDLSDPNSFHHVCWFDVNPGDLGTTGDRNVFEIIDTKAQSLVGQQFSVFTANQTWNTPNSSKKIYAKNAHVTDGVIRYETILSGLAGNKSLQIRQSAGAAVGSETAVLSGNVITITIAQYQTSIAQVQAAIAAAPEVAALIRAVPVEGYVTSSTLGNVWLAKFVMGAHENWAYEGYWGFGYCNINEFDFVVDGYNLSTAAVRKSPRGFPGEHMIEAFRLNRLS